jgi:LacI family transcriptional regulator
MVTVYDIARQAGVSTATVSRVLHGSSLVRPETRQRVVDVIERLGFVPNGSAQGLSMRRKDIIGLVALERGADEIDIERSSQLYVDEIVHAVEGVLRGTEISLLLSFGPRGESFQRRIQTLSGKVDGLLMAEDVLPASQLVALAKRVPLVLIARSADATGLDALTVDNAGGVRAAVTHLTGVHGYRRLCFVGGPPDSPDAKQRLAAFGEAVRGADGCSAEPAVHGDFSEASGSAAARALLARGAEP